MRYFPYFQARRVARDMDARGERPGLFIRAIIGVGSLAALGFCLAIAAAVLDFIGWELGLL